jgi:hypothetical protein
VLHTFRKNYDVASSRRGLRMILSLLYRLLSILRVVRWPLYYPLRGNRIEKTNISIFRKENPEGPMAWPIPTERDNKRIN